MYFTTTVDVIQQALDLVILGALLYNFRARDWPNYYLIVSYELGNLAQVAQGAEQEVNISEAQALFGKSQSDEEIQTEDLSEKNVIFINPSYEEEYAEIGLQKMAQEGRFFQYFRIGTQDVPKDVSDSAD
mmetsp:Transcript_39450/g.39005  ORF Transcript_39450/g.39005 Transcript_39450/m.39005 type:complete len:130 (-) Transcript_39450:10-399(-)